MPDVTNNNQSSATTTNSVSTSMSVNLKPALVAMLAGALGGTPGAVAGYSNHGEIRAMRSTVDVLDEKRSVDRANSDKFWAERWPKVERAAESIDHLVDAVEDHEKRIRALEMRR